MAGEEIRVIAQNGTNITEYARAYNTTTNQIKQDARRINVALNGTTESLSAGDTLVIRNMPRPQVTSETRQETTAPKEEPILTEEKVVGGIMCGTVGVLAGLKIGAACGSIGGPVGAVCGAIIGAGIGWIIGDLCD